MTIPKNAGLSHLAEAANPNTHYPVKRKGERRRLDPNWDGIRWLEQESADDCEIERQMVSRDDGLIFTEAYGRDGRAYSRPMFQIIEMIGIENWRGQTATPCQCDRFEQSWNCELHPEISWNAERRCWVRPGTSIWYELHPEDRPDGWEARSSRPAGARVRPERQPDGQPVPQILLEAYQQILAGLSASGFTQSSAPCTCSICRSGGNRLQYFDSDPRSEQRSVAERVALEWERENGIPLADAVRRIPDDLAPRRSMLDALPDGSMTVQLDNTYTVQDRLDWYQARNITMEVNGETVQGVSSFTIEIEGTDGT